MAPSWTRAPSKRATKNGRKFFSTFGRCAMVAKMLGILPNCFEGLTKQFGKIPNIFATMAHRPNVLKNFLPFFVARFDGALVHDGAIERKEILHHIRSMCHGGENVGYLAELFCQSF